MIALSQIYERLRREGSPLSSLLVVLAPVVDPNVVSTYHNWNNRIVRAIWGATPSIDNLAKLNAALAGTTKAELDAMNRLSSLTEVAQQKILLGVLAHYLVNNPALSETLGVSP